MAIKVLARNRALLVRFVMNPWGRAFIVAFALCGTLMVATFTYFYVKYAGIIEEKLRNGPFGNTSLLYAAPKPMMLNDPARVSEIVDYLHRVGYSDSSRNRLGWYHVRPDAVDINPGPDGYDPEGAVIKIYDGHVSQIISLRDNTERTRYELQPELITNLFDQKREKRRIVEFGDIPKVMVNAVLAAEDKRFFEHSGFDPIGILRASWIDLRDRKGTQGASTLTQQLARTLWLGPERGWRRKLPETLITLHLEQKLSKEKIFEDYANAIYLGHQGSFSIHGFGQAASVYLGKDLSHVTLPDAALIAGLIQSPIGRNPFKYPDRARQRRNLVLRAMHDNDFITEKEYEDAAASPLALASKDAGDSSDAPYFVDLINETLTSRFENYDFQGMSFRVYTTLDMDLQRDAVEAVRIGIQETDKLWAKRSKKYGTAEMPMAQVALVALDADTGELKALVGGRNYGASQLNHAIARRQPGSSFKPFVYATAFGTALQDGAQAITPATVVTDEPTTFMFDGNPYEPADFEKPQGAVTLRQALAHSLNIPAVKVAEMVGFDRVAETARQVGLNLRIRPTPAIALGAYEVTPLEIAAAYTVFPNAGQLLKPGFIKSIRDQDSGTLFDNKPERKYAMDPRVSYLTLSLMQEVLRSGTGAGVRARGFYLPAAGKTGTSRDGWFAGFTSRVICIVWVGFDDNRDIKLEGAHSALPIWTEFMKRAHQHSAYKNVREFSSPEGVVTADIDAETGQLATPNCPKVISEVFIAGSEPVEACHLHGGGRTQIAGWESASEKEKADKDKDKADRDMKDAAGETTVASAENPKPVRAKKVRSIPVTPEPAQPPVRERPAKGFFGRIRDIFR